MKTLRGIETQFSDSDRYNNRHVHGTTKEIPAIRFERALKEKKSLFREFKIN
ncbi:MAG: hypothetical protein HY578_02015 [Nitrospinae bacterium]|nr:hypothetical protein [Nitrospinota bacterium]